MLHALILHMIGEVDRADVVAVDGVLKGVVYLLTPM
jgi:hypothetical protein